MGHQSTWCHRQRISNSCHKRLTTVVRVACTQPFTHVLHTPPTLALKLLVAPYAKTMTKLCRKVHATNSCCQNWHTKACNPKQQKLPLPSRPPRPPIHSGSCAVSCRSRHSFSPLLPPNKNTRETDNSSQTGPGQYVWGPWSYGALEYGVIVKAASCHSQPPAKTKHSTVQSTISK